MTNPVEEFKTVTSFCVGSEWRFYPDLKGKKLNFAFKPSEISEELWRKYGFSKLRYLLTYLKSFCKCLDNFELTFFEKETNEPYYIVDEGVKKKIFININNYLEFGKPIDAFIDELKITKYSKQIMRDYFNKIPPYFFEKKNPNSLIEELKTSYYSVVEKLINEYETMPEPERLKLKTAFEHSKLGTETIKKYVELNPDAPERQLKLFLQVIDKLGEKDVEELLSSILNSKSSKYLIKYLVGLPPKEQSRIIKNMPEMSKVYDRVQKLEKSLKDFKKLIEERQNSQNKDEKSIHLFLLDNYWILGVQYFDKEIKSDIDLSGRRTKETMIGKKHSDFIIKRIDGLDKCVIIELEEANDKIFRDDGTFSKEVYDGISQAVDYCIEQRVKKISSKGIAIIGSLSCMNLTSEQKERLRLLSESFHNIEILTYNEIIDRAQTTIDFVKKYESLRIKQSTSMQTSDN